MRQVILSRDREDRTAAQNPELLKTNIMKRIITLILVGAVGALSSLAFAKEKEKESSQPGSTVAVAEHKMFAPADIKWVDGPPSLPPGAKLAILEGDPAKPGPFTIRLQAPDGYKIPAHTHPTAERITVISGTFHMGMADKFDEAAGHEMVAGSFAIMPAGTKHFAWATGETVVQVHSTGPFVIKYVNPADDPRNAKK
jgi:anti-sigma factor ChrR (cupin superfamily)